MISDSAKNAILERIDVRDVLDRCGISYDERKDGLWACCPFAGHNETTPSFVVAYFGPAKGCWRCYGCKAQKTLGGGLVSLVENALDLRRTDVVEDGQGVLDRKAAWAILAELAGVSLDPVRSAREGKVEHTLRLAPKVPPRLARSRLAFPDDSVPARDSPDAMAYLLARVTEEQVDRYAFRWWPERRRVIVPSVVGGVLKTWDARSVDLRCRDCRRDVPAWMAKKGDPCPCGRGTLQDRVPKTFGASIEQGADGEGAIFGYDWIPPRAKLVAFTEGPWGALHVQRLLGIPSGALRGTHVSDRPRGTLGPGHVQLMARFPLVLVIPDEGDAGSRLERALGPLVGKTEVLVGRLPWGQPDDHDGEALEGVVLGAKPPELVARPRVEFSLPARKPR